MYDKIDIALWLLTVVIYLTFLILTLTVSVAFTPLVATAVLPLAIILLRG